MVFSTCMHGLLPLLQLISLFNCIHVKYMCKRTYIYTHTHINICIYVHTCTRTCVRVKFMYMHGCFVCALSLCICTVACLVVRCDTLKTHTYVANNSKQH